MKNYMVFGRFGGVLGIVSGFGLTNAEFTAFREYGSRFGYVRLFVEERI